MLLSRYKYNFAELSFKFQSEMGKLALKPSKVGTIRLNYTERA